MKKIKLSLILFLFLFILFPCMVKAATFLEASTQRPVVGSDIYVLLTARYGNLDIREMYLRIKYDPSYFTYEESYWIQGTGTVTNKNGYLYIKKPNNGRIWTAGNQMQFKFKVLKTGISKIEVDAVDENGNVVNSYYTNGDPIAQSFANVTINSVNPSTNTFIGGLSVEGYTISPTFSQTTYEYRLTVPPNVSSVNIQASKGEANQTITGDGVKKLNYGQNRARIVVSAQDGSSRTYQIMITRTDDRTGDTTLKSLAVSNTNISYQKGKTTYDAEVGRSTESVLITATSTDSRATIVGTGTKKLNIGLNTFNLKVTSSSGAEANYTINITRSNEERNIITESSKLKALKINNMALPLGTQTNYLYSVNKDTSQLPIEYETESETAEVKIEGNENLKEGINLVKIIVTEKNKDKTEYKIVVYKHPSNATLVTDLNTLLTSNIIYETSNSESHIIPQNILNNLKTNNMHLYYDVVDTYGGLLYQVDLYNNLPSTDLDISLTQENANSLTYTTKIPESNNILLYLNDKYQDGSVVRIYSCDESGKYTLITDGYKVNNGYVSFTTNGAPKYIITTQELIKEEGPLTKFINKYKMYFILGFIVLIVLIIIIKKISKQKKIKEQNEPLY